MSAMAAHPIARPKKIEIDGTTWVECPICKALNYEKDRECVICHYPLHQTEE